MNNKQLMAVFITYRKYDMLTVENPLSQGSEHKVKEYALELLPHG